MEGGSTWGPGVFPRQGSRGQGARGGAGAEPPSPKIFDIFY